MRLIALLASHVEIRVFFRKLAFQFFRIVFVDVGAVIQRDCFGKIADQLLNNPFRGLAYISTLGDYLITAYSDNVSFMQ